jgi:GTP-binding protein HflX
MIRVSLVGYSNVGKSTIMNLLSKSNVFAEDKLFATLDTTVRKMVIHNLSFLLSDTVGFIRKLPHTLVESFKSTLDEVRESDLLVHIVDISHPGFEEQIDVVKQTLTDIGASDKPTIMLFNKIDAYSFIEKESDDLTPSTKQNLNLKDLENTWMAKANVPSLFISATEKMNIDQLRELLYQEVSKLRNMRYPPNNL